MGLAIGVDVGGTKILAGVIDDDGRVLDHERVPTPAGDAAAVSAAISQLVVTLRDRCAGTVETVGIGAAGFINADRSVVMFAPHLAWRDTPLRDDVAEVVNLPVVVENDANAMGWAEDRFGAGREARSLLAITIGTGIGGAIVLDGQLYRGAHGVAGEPGHLVVVPDGRSCPCGQRGCWEEYGSGRSLGRLAREKAIGDPAAAGHLVDAAGGDMLKISGEHVTRLAPLGDPMALEVLAEVGTWIGRGLASLTSILDPETIVVGGGVSEVGDLLLDTIRTELLQHLSGRGHRPAPTVVLAALGNDAGMIGAADLSRQRTPARTGAPSDLSAADAPLPEVPNPVR